LLGWPYPIPCVSLKADSGFFFLYSSDRTQIVHAAPLRWFVRECFAPLASALGRAGGRDPQLRAHQAAAGSTTTTSTSPPVNKQEL
jgi:hypothetical protein